MRKRDIFGKRVDTQKPLYFIFIIFTIAIIGYLALNSWQTSKLLDLQEEENQIQVTINNMLYLNQESSYQEVGELLPYLPNSYSEATLFNELLLLKNLTGLANAGKYQIEIDNEADSPFSDDVDDSLRYVMIEIDMEIDDYTDIFDYIDNLESMDRLYYVDSISLTLLGDDLASISMVIYTFYMTE
ncbi:MAG: hypothetical protein JEZ05_00035 [Tenericutes bacterium]|nr:hypothetical protein [Mycoplasmatota bacterium]